MQQHAAGLLLCARRAGDIVHCPAGPSSSGAAENASSVMFAAK